MYNRWLLYLASTIREMNFNDNNKFCIDDLNW